MQDDHRCNISTRFLRKFVYKYFQPFLSSSVRDLEAGGELGEGIVSVALLGVTRDKGKGCLPGQLGLRHETNH